jgi:SH3 domain protein
MYRALISALSILSLYLVSPYSMAAYVTDRLEVPVRAGESREFRILRYLQAGTELQIIELSANGYARIRDDRNRTGFILARYLVEETPLSLRTGPLDAELAKKKEAIQRLKKEIKKLNNALNQSATENSEAKLKVERTESELNNLIITSGDVITLRNRLVVLETERQVLLSDNQTLRAEKLAAGDDSAKTWFGLGALVLGLGWFIGFLMPRFQRRRVSNDL